MNFPFILSASLCLLAPLIAGCAAYPRQYPYSGYPARPSAYYYYGRQPHFPQYPYDHHLIVQRKVYPNSRPYKHWINGQHPYPPHRHRKHDDDGGRHHDHDKIRPDHHHSGRSAIRLHPHGNRYNGNRPKNLQNSKSNQRHGQNNAGRQNMPTRYAKRTPRACGHHCRNRR